MEGIRSNYLSPLNNLSCNQEPPSRSRTPSQSLNRSTGGVMGGGPRQPSCPSATFLGARAGFDGRSSGGGGFQGPPSPPREVDAGEEVFPSIPGTFGCWPIVNCVAYVQFIGERYNPMGISVACNIVMHQSHISAQFLPLQTRTTGRMAASSDPCWDNISCVCSVISLLVYLITNFLGHNLL